MAADKHMIITDKGAALHAKAQTGVPIHFTKMRVGSGELGTRNPAILNDLVDGKLDVLISSITPYPDKKSATIVGSVTNKGVLEPTYICEIGVYANDPDEGEILYGYVNYGMYGDYYAPETQGPYSWQYQIAVAIGNAANVTVELAELNFDYAVINTNTTFMVLSGGNQKEINKAIDTKLKSQGDSIANLSTQVTKNTNDIAEVSTDLTNYKEEVSTQMADFVKIKKNINILANGWIDDTLTSGFWKYDISDVDITEDVVVDVNIHLSDLEKASDIKSSNLSDLGKVTLYADKQPTEDILCDFNILKQVV